MPLTCLAGARRDPGPVDNDDYDVLHRDIDMDKLKVTYDGKGVHATITMKNLKKKKRLRIFVGMVTRCRRRDPISPEFGHLIEFRLNERRRQKVVNWVVEPSPTTTTSSRSARASRSRRTTRRTR